MADENLQDVGLLYQSALEHQFAGRIEDARVAYLFVLAADPRHPEANHNLGMLEFSAGNHSVALQLLMNAVEAAPRQPEYWRSLIAVLRALGAEEHVEQALVQAWEAGLDGKVLAELRTGHRGEQGAAEADGAGGASPASSAEDAIRARVWSVIDKSTPGANRGGKSSRPLARKQAEQMIELYSQRRHEELEKRALRMVKDRPDHPSGWHFLGSARLARGEVFEAVQNLLKANELFPGDSQLLGHLGIALGRLGYFREADVCFQLSRDNCPPSDRSKATQLDVMRFQVFNKMMLGKLDEAGEIADLLLELAPDDGISRYVKSSVLLGRQKNEEAIALLEQAVERNPKLMEAYQDLGLALFNSGRLTEAIEYTKKGIMENSDFPAAYSNLLFFLSHDENADPQAVFEYHLGFGERFETPLRSQWQAHANDPDPDRKLRIGFVSADFNEHAVANFILPVLQNMDRQQFDLFGIYCGTRQDRMTERLKQEFLVWINAVGVSDQDLAVIVRAAKIDILVDLSGHTAGNRLLMFAHKPAPVQVSWIGYPNTTGMQAMDYTLDDRFNCPEGLYDRLFTEKIVRLTVDAPFVLPYDAPAVNRLPALENGFLTFGSFNRLGKISRKALDLWCEAMHACERSRLLMASVNTEEEAERMRREFQARGVEPERLMFEPKLGMHEYLSLHHRVDVVLDTFPYNGGTTSCYALGMGVPVLAIAGFNKMSNHGAGLMRSVGLDFFVAETKSDFVNIAVKVQNDLQGLANIRQGLRDVFLATGNRESASITNEIGMAFREMWRIWCRGEAPRSFDVGL